MVVGEKPYSAVITAVAHYVPDKIVTNADLEKVVDTSDEWIRERTGIGERRVLEGEPTSFMAIEVARQILERRQLDPAEIDLIIVATITPDMVFRLRLAWCRIASALVGRGPTIYPPPARVLFMQ